MKIALRPAWLHLKGVCLIACDLQIRRRFRMMPLQREGALVIQNRTSKVARAKVGVAEIVKYIRARLPRANESLITGDRVLEMTLSKLLVCLCKLGIRLRKNQ